MGLGVRVIRDMRQLVDGSPNTVSAQFADDREAGPSHLSFHHLADFKDAESRARDEHRLMKSPLRASHQVLRLRTDFADWHGDGGVGHVAVLFNGYVQLHQVAFLEEAIAWNSMDG